VGLLINSKPRSVVFRAAQTTWAKYDIPGAHVTSRYQIRITQIIIFSPGGLSERKAAEGGLELIDVHNETS
jgi:hypothetical protein